MSLPLPTFHTVPPSPETYSPTFHQYGRATRHLLFHRIIRLRSYSQNPTARDPAFIQFLLQLGNLLQTLRVSNQDLDTLSLFGGEFDTERFVRGDGAVRV